MGASSKSVALAFAVNIGLCIGFFFLFSYLRLLSLFRRFYAPKRFDSTVQNKPRRLPAGYFGWVKVITSYPEAELIKSAGLDSAMYVRVLTLGWEVFIKVSLVTLIIILPINLSGDRISALLDTANQSPPPPSPPPPAGCGIAEDSISEDTSKYSFSTFDYCSLANIPPGSPRFWAHLVVQWVVTFMVMATLWRFSKEATLLRLAFIANAPRGGPSHTVLVTDIPGMKFGTMIWYLRGLVGSTLFVFLPASVKKKVLDTIEMGVNAAVTLDVTAAVGTVGKHTGVIAKQEDWEVTEPSDLGPSRVMDALSMAAMENSRIAEMKEESKRKAATGIIQRKRRTADIISTDPKLDPWVQAEEVLGNALEPRADKVKEFIHNEVEFAYGGGCVAAVNPVWDQGALNPVLAELEALKLKLEDRLDMLASCLKRRKKLPKPLKVTVMGPTLGAWGIEKYGLKPVKVEALVYWPERIAYLASVIPTLQAQCTTKAIPAAFVTLQTRHTQAVMTTTLHHHDETTWQIQGAPEPKEIIWGSLPMRRWERSVRSLVIWVAFVVLLCFYMIPIAAVQALIEVPKLASVPVLGTIVNLPFIKQIIEGILPGLILMIFLALLPALLAFMCRLSGFISESQVDFGVVVRYFYFQVVALFLGSIIAGSFFNQLKQLINRPQTIINILGVAIPATSTFFINYILVAGVGKTGFKHMRIPQFVIFYLLSKIAATPRARARLWADQFTQYGPEVPNHNMIFFLGLVYCCINPIIAPVCLLYYTFTTVSARYNSLYVFKRTYESGGKLWYFVFNQTVMGLYAMQIIMIILLSLKQFKPVFLLIPLPFITFTFHITTLTLFKRPWECMSAHDAAQLDVMDAEDRKGQGPMDAGELQTIRDMYLSPAFKVHPEDVDNLLKETEVIKRRLAGEKLEDIEAEMEEDGYISAGDEPADDDPLDDDDSSNADGSPEGRRRTAAPARLGSEDDIAGADSADDEGAAPANGKSTDPKKTTTPAASATKGSVTASRRVTSHGGAAVAPAVASPLSTSPSTNSSAGGAVATVTVPGGGSSLPPGAASAVSSPQLSTGGGSMPRTTAPARPAAASRSMTISGGGGAPA